MTAGERALLSQMDDYTLDGKFHEATEAFCRLAAGGHDVRKRTLAPDCYELYQRYFMS